MADEIVTAVFTDKDKINVTALSATNLTIGGPAAINATGVSIIRNTGKMVTASFTVAAPAGGWTADDNGVYQVALAGGAVSDAAGAPSSAASTTFQVDVPLPAGAIDPKFGGGSVSLPFMAEAVAAQPDGKLVVVGHQGDLAGGHSQGVVARLNSDGSVDTNFGNAGEVVSPAGNNDAFYSVLVRSDGQIIVAGRTTGSTGSSTFLVAAYASSGQPDASFGQSGRSTADFGGSSATAYSAAITGGNAILVGGAADGRFAFAQFDAAGKLDATFGQGGLDLFALSNGSDAIGTVALSANGMILAAGASGTRVVVMRLTAAGDNDTTFASNGVAIISGLASSPSSALVDHAVPLDIQDTGLLVGGRTSDGHFGVVRLNAGGAVDTAFGIAGLATASFGGDEKVDALTIDGSNRILAVGRASSSTGVRVGVAAFDPAGNLLSSFGNAGTAAASSAVAADATAATGEFAAFSTLQNGELILGSGWSAATVMHRMVVTPTASPGAVQSFGTVGGKQRKAIFRLSDGTNVTLTLSGGTATAALVGDQLELMISAGRQGAAVSLRATGGSHHVTLDRVMVAGSLRTFTAPTADLAGSLAATGTIGAISVGNVKGTISSGGGVIGRLTATSLAGATILSGADLGADGVLGGSGANADAFHAGKMGVIRIFGNVSESIIGAGVDAADDVVLDARTALGGAASSIGSILVTGAVDDSSRFVAGAFRSVRLPRPVMVASDPHVFILPA